MATRLGLEKWFPEALSKFGVYTVFDLMKKYIEEEPEKSKLDSIYVFKCY